MNRFLLLLCLPLVACASASVTKDVLTPDYLLMKGSAQLTFLGDNDHPRFSPDNKKILFSSRGRSTHRGFQVYEMDLETAKERRVTFSDGDAFDAIYSNESEIIYSSTTDEIKESPFANRNISGEFLPSDLYMSEVYGNNIIRLTKQPSFDGEPVFYPEKNRLSVLFTSRRGDLLGIYRLDSKNLTVSLISAEKEKAKRFPSLSPNKENLIWLETDLKGEVQSLVSYNLKKKIPIVLKSGEGEYRDLFFAPRSPDRLFYSVLRKGEKKFQLEVYNLETHCTQVVFKGQDSLLSPAVSNSDREKLAFVRLFQDKKQIYTVHLPADLGPCLEASTQANLKE